MEFHDIPLQAYFVSCGHILGGVLYQKVNCDDGYKYWTRRWPQGATDDTFPEFPNVQLISQEAAAAIIATLQPTKRLDGVICVDTRLKRKIKKRHKKREV